MPWDLGDVVHKTKKAKSAKRKRQWIHVANGALARGASDKTAIMEANGVVAKSVFRDKAARDRSDR